MTREQNIVVAAMLAATLAVPAAAMAQTRDISGPYIGGSIGQSKYTDVPACASVTCDTKDKAWRVLIGYQINRNLAAELGYHDLGKVKISGPASAELTGNAWELVGIAALPLGPFSLYGKAGAYQGELKTGGAKETNSELTYGLGAQVDFGRQAALRAEWQRYRDMGGDSVGGKSKVDVASVGVLWRFR